MKRRTLCLALVLAAALAALVSAAGGDAKDPLVSLRYLREVFAPEAEKAIQERLK